MSRELLERPDRLEPGVCAVIAIDLQNDFCHPQGLQARQGRDVSRVQEPLLRAQSLMAEARRVGVPVYLVQNQHSPASDSAEWLNRHPDPHREQSCQTGSWGAEFCGFEPGDGDHVVPKTRYSAFINTTLADDLRAAGRTSLLFAGVTTATCVESSLRDAVCMDFLGTLVEDCCGAYTDEAHQRGVRAVTAGFGEVRSLDEVILAWRVADDEGNVA